MSQSTTVCLIHGHGVDASIWDGVYADSFGVGSVLKPDFSRLTTLTTIDDYADELRTQVLNHVQEPVVLVGHSMGGYVALAFAEKYPQLVGGLMLYHSTAYADDEARRVQRRETINALKTQGSEPFIERQLPKMVAPDYPPEKTQQLVDRFRGLPADALAEGLRAIAGRPDRTAVLRDATFPVCLVLGRKDQILDYEKTVPLANLADRIQLVTIENAGHLSMVEQPTAALQVFRTFVGQC